jgi:hypothetical protein
MSIGTISLICREKALSITAFCETLNRGGMDEFQVGYHL